MQNQGPHLAEPLLVEVTIWQSAAAAGELVLTTLNKEAMPCFATGPGISSPLPDQCSPAIVNDQDHRHTDDMLIVHG